jgi:hypothetical protein
LTPHRPVRTFDTACTYYHKFRLNFRDAEYNYQDAALASLFVACKVEDTIKKSKDILAAAYNVKNPDKTVAPDDKVRTSCIHSSIHLFMNKQMCKETDDGRRRCSTRRAR